MNWALDMAAAEGRMVCQGHADYCAAHGHASKVDTDRDGISTVSLYCPRCGELSDGKIDRVLIMRAA